MANALTVGKAKIAGLAMGQIFGQEPQYYYADDHVRLYYDADKLRDIQKRIEMMESSGPSDVRVDWLPMITPLALKKAVPIIGGIVLVGIIIGRATK